MKLLAPHFMENPILTRELRTRMRGARAFWVLFAYLGILSVILFVTYLQWWRNTVNSGPMIGAFRIGREFYYSLFIVKALLVAAITPALTAGGISIEKEQRTFDLLSISLLPRSAVVLGKLFSALAFVALLLTSSLPLVSIGFLLGGVAPDEVAISYGLLLLAAFVYGAVGIASSTVARNTTTATVLTYGIILLLFFATLPLSSFGVTAAIPGASNQNIGGLKSINPLGAVMAGTLGETYFGHVVPAWLTALVLNGLFGVICILVAIHRLDWPRSDRSGVLRLLVAVFASLVAIAVYGLFAPGATPAWAIKDIGIVASLTLVGVSILVPIFATADELPGGNLLGALLDPRRLPRGEAPSGVVYSLLITLLCSLILYGGLIHGSGNLAIVSTGIKKGVSLAAPFGSLGEMTILLVATVWGIGGFSLLATALLKNRTGALATVAGTILLIYLVPISLVNAREITSTTSASLLQKVSALTPWVALQEVQPAGRDFLVNHLGKMSAYTSVDHFYAVDRIPLSTAAALIYFAGGGCCLIAADRLRRRSSRSATDSGPNPQRAGSLETEEATTAT